MDGPRPCRNCSYEPPNAVAACPRCGGDLTKDPALVAPVAPVSIEPSNIGRTVRRSAIQPGAGEMADGDVAAPHAAPFPADPAPARPTPPSTTVVPEPAVLGVVGVPATLGQRFAAYLIDTVVLSGAWIGIQIAGFVLVLLASMVNESLGNALGVLVLITAIAAVAWVAVSMFVAVGRIGQTPGKRTLGVQVIDADNGGPIGTGRAVIRQLVLVLMNAPCYLGLLSFFMDDTNRHRAFHDKAANDVVVTTTPVPFVQAVKDVLTILRRPAS